MSKYIHKSSGEEVVLIKSHGVVGRFEIVSSEEKQRYLRFGKRRIVCLMSEVEIIN